MQASMVFNQTRWPAAGDVDDCWVVASIQAANVTLPWAPLVSVKTFREAAGDPDDGVSDGGTIAEVRDGLTGVYPELRGRLAVFAKSAWSDYAGAILAHRPMVAFVWSAALPPRLRYGFDGAHAITIIANGAGEVLVANPLAAVYSRWDRATLEDLREAVLVYGMRKASQRSCYGVALPTDAEALALHPLYGPALAARTAELEAQLARARAELVAARSAGPEAHAAVDALNRYLATIGA